MIWLPEQINIINKAVHHIRYGSDLLYEYTGRAGTGKSTVLIEIIRQCGIPLHRIAFMTYVGAPSILLRQKGFYNAKTAHSWLYEPVDLEVRDDLGNVLMDPVFNKPITKLAFVPKPIEDIDLIVVDEAWMIPSEIAKELKSRGIKLLAMGDRNQLPPVAGKPGFLLDPDIDRLETPVRQGAGSGILYIADRAIKGLPIHTGFYNDTLVIEREELTDRMIMSANVVLCGTNATRDYVNKRVREDLLNIHSDVPVYGDRLICRMNNWMVETDGINLANGLAGACLSSPDASSFNKEKRTITLDFLPDKMINPFYNIDLDYDYLNANYHMKNDMKSKKYNFGEKFDYAYGLTTHLSQGSEYNNVVYMEEYLSKEINANLYYTGATRAKQTLIYVKQKRKYW